VRAAVEVVRAALIIRMLTTWRTLTTLRAGRIMILHPPLTVFDHNLRLTVYLLDPLGTTLTVPYHRLPDDLGP